MENELKFNVKSEPQYDTIDHELDSLDSMTDSVLEARVQGICEPKYGTMIENEVKPDSLTNGVLEAQFQVKKKSSETVIWIKSEPEKVISIKSEPEGDACIKREVEVDVSVKSELEADDWLERELETVLEFPEIKNEDSKVSVFKLSFVCNLN